MNTTQPTELEQLRFIFRVMQDHLPHCACLRSFDFGEDDCTCQRADRLEALRLVLPPPPVYTAEQDAADSARRDGRADRVEAIYYGHVPLDGDGALALDEWRAMARECGRLNAEISRTRRTLAQREREIAHLRHALYGGTDPPTPPTGAG